MKINGKKVVTPDVTKRSARALPVRVSTTRRKENSTGFDPWLLLGAWV
jgi:hypothetical protein